jgi:hypothetical protein
MIPAVAYVAGFLPCYIIVPSIFRRTGVIIVRHPTRKVRRWPTAWWRLVVRIHLHSMTPRTTTNTTRSTRRYQRYRRRRRRRRRRNIHSSSLLCTPRHRNIRVFQRLIKLRQRTATPFTIQGRRSGSGISEGVSPHPCKGSIVCVPALVVGLLERPVGREIQQAIGI